MRAFEILKVLAKEPILPSIAHLISLVDCDHACPYRLRFALTVVTSYALLLLTLSIQCKGKLLFRTRINCNDDQEHMSKHIDKFWVFR